MKLSYQLYKHFSRLKLSFGDCLSVSAIDWTVTTLLRCASISEGSAGGWQTACPSGAGGEKHQITCLTTEQLCYQLTFLACGKHDPDLNPYV